MRNVLSALAAVLVFSMPAIAQPVGPAPTFAPPAVSGSMGDAEIGAALDAWLSDLNQRGVFNGAVLIARDGREIWSGAYGLANLEPGVPLDVDTRFPLASITKQLTQAAVLQLIQAGQLSPETTIGEVLPSYPNEVSRSATVQQLIGHRGGIADFLGPDFRDQSKDRFTGNHVYYEYVSRLPPRFAPGEREEYCNGCYVVLGEMIEQISGVSYERYVTDHVLAQAGMNRAGFFRHDQLPDNSAQFLGRPMGPQGELRDVSRWHGVSASAAGNSYATVRDMLAFDNAIREGRLLNSQYSAQMLRSEPQTGRHTGRIRYAGGAPGVNTVLAGNGAWTVIVLTNHEPPTAETMGPMVFSLLAGPPPQ